MKYWSKPKAKALWHQMPPSYSAECVHVSYSRSFTRTAISAMLQIRSTVIICLKRDDENRMPLLGPLSVHDCSCELSKLFSATNFLVRLKHSDNGTKSFFIFRNKCDAKKFMDTWSKNCQLIVSLDKFKPLATIGRGSWGKVMLCRELNNCTRRKYFAIKEIAIKRKTQIERVKEELRTMITLKGNPFVITLHYSLKKGSHFYFVLDFMPGGDFVNVLKKFNIRPSKLIFYAVEVLLALEYIHAQKIVHRDLKPENILLDHRGHIKLCDFGLAKLLANGEKTRTVCGTIFYMAPEMLKSYGYNFSVDFWLYGCFIYEMYIGCSPFFKPTFGCKEEVKKCILQGYRHSPLNCSLSSREIIKNLLVSNPKMRTGCKNGWTDVKNMRYFRKVDWEVGARKRFRPPISNVQGRTGIDLLHSNFGEILDDEPKFCGDDKAESICDSELLGCHYVGF